LQEVDDGYIDDPECVAENRTLLEDFVGTKSKVDGTRGPFDSRGARGGSHVGSRANREFLGAASAAAESAGNQPVDQNGPRMNVVVDTNVIAYCLLGTEPFAEECLRFWRRTHEVSAPALWKSELVNVLWMAVRSRIITADESAERLRLVTELAIRSVSVRQLWRGSLIRAIESGVSAYDTLFVELAARRKLQLATYDAQLLRKFPTIATRPNDLY
jgi:predicted nucleic acid-binding protein